LTLYYNISIILSNIRNALLLK